MRVGRRRASRRIITRIRSLGPPIARSRATQIPATDTIRKPTPTARRLMRAGRKRRVLAVPATDTDMRTARRSHMPRGPATDTETPTRHIVRRSSTRDLIRAGRIHRAGISSLAMSPGASMALAAIRRQSSAAQSTPTRLPRASAIQALGTRALAIGASATPARGIRASGILAAILAEAGISTFCEARAARHCARIIDTRAHRRRAATSEWIRWLDRRSAIDASSQSA